MKAAQGSCREDAVPLCEQRAGGAAAWHPVPALCALVGAPRSSCILNSIPSVFWDGSHGSGEPGLRGGGVCPCFPPGAAPVRGDRSCL